MKSLLIVWIRFQKNQPVLFVALFIAAIGFGTYYAAQSEIEAFPDLTNVQVQVITQFPGKAAEEVERLITVPVEVSTNGVPGLINQRSISVFGLSVVTLTFDDNVKSRQARLDVSQRLGDGLPEGVKPSLSPDSTPVGEIFRYTLKSNDLPADELRMIEDWRLEKEFKSIPGVADVVSFGGPTRTVEIKLDIPRLKTLGLSVAAVAQALGQNHANAGGSIVNHGEESFIVRSIGLYEKPESLEAAVISTQKGVPVRVRDIGIVQIGRKARLGQVGLNANSDAVEGIILLRQGADTLETCRAIREKISNLNKNILPKGTTIESYYDRTELISRSSSTVLHNIFFGILLVCILLVAGLGVQYWQMVLAVVAIIPFALLTAMVGVQVFGYKPNLISLGAVDFGIIVETAIFGAESVIAFLALKKERNESDWLEALVDVLAPALICALLLLIAFIPILTLQRVEGRIFRPLGITLVSALIGGQVGAFLFVPFFSQYCPYGQMKHGVLEPFFEKLLVKAKNCAVWFTGQSQLAIKLGVCLFVLIFLLMFTIGREFLPQLNEGSLYIRATAPPTISLEASIDLAAKIRSRLKDIPEVVDVVSQIGRPDDGTDVNGYDNIEIFVSLKPPGEWKSAHDIDGMTVVAQKMLDEIAGVDFNYSQPIKDNVDEAISGVKGELVVKLFGPKIEVLQELADKIKHIVESVPGGQDVAAEQLLSQPELRFEINRELLARYGLRVTDAEDVLETALNGRAAAKLTDEQGRQVDIVVRPNLPDPPDKNILLSLPLLTPDGAKVNLGEVADARLVEGVSRIYREQGERRIAVKTSVRNRAVVDFVQEATAKIEKSVQLPDKYRMEWSGSFENAKRASQQLMIIVPICLLAMITLLYTWFQSWTTVFLLLWELPFSLVGALVALRLFALNLSISAAVGIVVLIGVSFLSGMILLVDWERTKDIWHSLNHKGRSILISSGVAIIGLIPAAFSHGIGSETAKPFAVSILGGLISSLLLTLLVLPALIHVSEKKT